MQKTVFLARVRDLIARDKLSEAIEQFRTVLVISPVLDEAILQSSRLEDIRRQIRQGIVDPDEANRVKNQIRAALLDLLREIETEGTNPEIKAEPERSVSLVDSKNVVIDSTISAGGDVHIGDVKKAVVQHAEKIYNIDKIDHADFL